MRDWSGSSEHFDLSYKVHRRRARATRKCYQKLQMFSNYDSLSLIIHQWEGPESLCRFFSSLPSSWSDCPPILFSAYLPRRSSHPHAIVCWWRFVGSLIGDSSSPLPVYLSERSRSVVTALTWIASLIPSSRIISFSSSAGAFSVNTGESVWLWWILAAFSDTSRADSCIDKSIGSLLEKST